MTNLNRGEGADVTTKDQSVLLEAIAELFGRAGLARDDTETLSAGTTVALDGYGSIARPLSEELARRGAQRFVLTDPKVYKSESVASQCTPDEIGRLKVDVGAERLQALGSQVTPFARDIYSVPEGVVTPDTIVIATVDNRRADIASNRRAARMGARLIKVNVEPAFDVTAVRAYDFRKQTAICVECQFSDHHYAAQHHPKSCDGSLDGRRTNSPRWLSQTAAQMGVLAALDLAGDGPAAQQWLAHEWQCSSKTGAVSRSRLAPKSNCRWDHDQRWQNVVRLCEDVNSISLRELIRAADIPVDTRVKIRFCQQVALRGRCSNCHTDVAVVRWFSDLHAPVGTCLTCGNEVTAIPFAVFSTTSLEPLLTVMDEPVAQWGVEEFAVIEIEHNCRCTTFVLGGT